jgi:hypothetical protein
MSSLDPTSSSSSRRTLDHPRRNRLILVCGIPGCAEQWKDALQTVPKAPKLLEVLVFWLPSSQSTSTHELLDSPETECLYIDLGEIVHVQVRVKRDDFCDESGTPKSDRGAFTLYSPEETEPTLL